MGGCSDPSAPARQVDGATESYYLEAALQGGRVEKWTRDLRVHWQGEPATGDVAALEEVVAEMDHLQVAPRVSMVNFRSDATVHVYFVPDSLFSLLCRDFPPYVSDPCSADAAGWALAFRGGDYAIDSARILIDNDWAGGRERLIRHELTHALGFRGHTRSRHGSILHEEWTDAPEEFLEIDRRIIRLHSLPGIRPGMDEEDVLKAIP